MWGCCCPCVDFLLGVCEVFLGISLPNKVQALFILRAFYHRASGTGDMLGFNITPAQGNQLTIHQMNMPKGSKNSGVRIDQIAIESFIPISLHRVVLRFSHIS